MNLKHINTFEQGCHVLLSCWQALKKRLLEFPLSLICFGDANSIQGNVRIERSKLKTRRLLCCL
jgi:hypothetical protein